MPDASPLRPMSHWRSGKPAIVCPNVLKAKPLRKRNGVAGEGEAKGSPAGRQRADAGDPRPLW